MANKISLASLPTVSKGIFSRLKQLPTFFLRHWFLVKSIVLLSTLVAALYIMIALIVPVPAENEVIVHKPKDVAIQSLEKIVSWQEQQARSLETGFDISSNKYFLETGSLGN